MFGSTSKRISYNQNVEGIWGGFSTPAGKVNFLMTKAKLSSTTLIPTMESRLTSLLCPVREVLDIKKMDFSQLLQRDLDDHRVATELLPYLIKPSHTGPAFFPPVLAALLPFNGMNPSNEFPQENYTHQITIDGFGEQLFEQWNYGMSYAFQRMLTEKGEIHSVKFGRLSWTDELAKLVVLDGQHRAMALLAIERTLSGTWSHSKAGNKYRHFYEHRVEALMEDAEREGGVDLSQVEFPVTLCWFPDFNGQGRNPHTAARKLFVDVNKNARQPSEARMVLLSDTELLNIFTRALLNRLRENNPPLPLHAVEYDNPDKESSRPVRWSVFTNITMMQNMIEKAVFGPPKYITDLSQTFGGRTSSDSMDDYMRHQLDIKNIFPLKIQESEERIIERDTIGNEIFPQYNKEAQKSLINNFMEKWGNAILHVLGEFIPYKKHIQAINELKQHWIADDAVSSLAYDAVFEGVGMYWTLRSSDNYWRERVRENLVEEKNKPEIVKAWKIIENKGKEFKYLRAKYFMDSSKEKEEDLTISENFYNEVNTYACQLGAIMTLATVQNSYQKFSPMEVSEILVRSWNAALEGGVVQSRNRMLLLSREAKWPMNMIAKMDSPHAVYFRYFFLQLLIAQEAKDIWKDYFEQNCIEDMINKSRHVYFDYLVKEKSKIYKKTHPNWSKDKSYKKAYGDVYEEFSNSLFKWFDLSKEEFATWLERGEDERSTQLSDFESEGDEVDRQIIERTTTLKVESPLSENNSDVENPVVDETVHNQSDTESITKEEIIQIIESM